MTAAKYHPGDRVHVRSAFPPGHVRTPYFIRGRDGVIEGLAGRYANPEELAYGRDGKPEQPLYRVRFRQTEVWADYDGAANDTVVIDLYEHWLEDLA